jgi:hypothetical protein
VSTDPDVPLASWGAKARLVFLVTFPISLVTRLRPDLVGLDGVVDGPWMLFRIALSLVVIVSGGVWIVAVHRRAHALRIQRNLSDPRSR